MTVHEEAQAPPEWIILGLFRSFPTDSFRAGLWSAANLLDHGMIGCLLSAVIGMGAIDSNAVPVTHCAVQAFQGRCTLLVRLDHLTLDAIDSALGSSAVLFPLISSGPLIALWQ